jgi:hypothetical protein
MIARVSRSASTMFSSPGVRRSTRAAPPRLLVSSRHACSGRQVQDGDHTASGPNLQRRARTTRCQTRSSGSLTRMSHRHRRVGRCQRAGSGRPIARFRGLVRRDPLPGRSAGPAPGGAAVDGSTAPRLHGDGRARQVPGRGSPTRSIRRAGPGPGRHRAGDLPSAPRLQLGDEAGLSRRSAHTPSSWRSSSHEAKPMSTWSTSGGGTVRWWLRCRASHPGSSLRRWPHRSSTLQPGHGVRRSQSSGSGRRAVEGAVPAPDRTGQQHPGQRTGARPPGDPASAMAAFRSELG